LVEYTFEEDLIYIDYTRKLKTLLDVLALVGGLFSSFTALGTAVCASICYNLMMSSLISKLYHFKIHYTGEKLKYPTKMDEEEDKASKKDDFYGSKHAYDDNEKATKEAYAQ
jgi:hypothetical protein